MLDLGTRQPMAKFVLDTEAITKALAGKFILVPTTHVVAPSAQEYESREILDSDEEETELESAARIAAALMIDVGTTSTVEPYLIDLSGTKYKIRDYQVQGIEFLRSRKKAFLTDKPGLGKTLQAALAAKPPVIIFCPTYLTYNWLNFLNEVAVPCGFTVVHATGPRERRQSLINTGADFLICNIEMLRDYEFPNSFTTLIIDEAHHLRGHNSQQSLKAVALSNSAEYIFLLTATPVMNRPDDLYAQLRLLDRDNFHSYYQFTQRYCTQVQMPFGPKVVGARASLKPAFERYNLGRTYKDVQMQLPDLVTDVIRVDPPEEFTKIYNKLKYQYYIPGKEVYENALEVLQALRKLTAPQKLKPLLSLLTDTEALSGTVIFSWYKETAEAVASLLEIPCVTGDLPPKERYAIAKSGQCISATISSMSEGVDLSHLHTVIFFELHYVPGQHFQALSRVRRAGGGDMVKVYYLLVKNTIDEVLYNVDSHRTVTINSIVRECLT